MGVTAVINGVTFALYGTLTATLAPSQPVGVEFTPVMNGPVTGQWTISATSEYSASGQIASAWLACTPGNEPTWTDKWSSAAQATPSAAQVWTLQSSASFQISALHLISRPDANTLEARSFQIMDNLTGNVLYDTGSASLTWADGEEKAFAFPALVTQSISVRVTASDSLCQFKVRLFS